MAQSRLEKIASIFTRVTDLMKGGVLKQEDLPVWYAVYKAFPPKYEPRFDRPGSQIPVNNIYYPEDIIRAKVQEKFKNVNSDFMSNKPSKSQQFIEEYQRLQKEGVPDSEIFKKTEDNVVPLWSKSFEQRESEERKIKKMEQTLNVAQLLKRST